MPPSSMRPAVGSARRHSSFTNVVLPEPVSPTTATDVPAGMSTSTAWSTVRSGAVGERDALGPHRHRARAAARDPRSGSTTSTGTVEDREHLAEPGQGGLGLVEDLAQLGDRAEQQVHQEQEGDELARAQSPVGPVPDADGDDDG